jgi:phosphatidylglycerol:prolipoprotein diacylglycerol transferase
MFPVLFQIGPIIIYSLWLFIGIAFIAGVFIFSYLAKNKRLNLNFIYKYTFQIFIFGLLGARLFFIIGHYQMYYAKFSFDLKQNIPVLEKILSLLTDVFSIKTLFYLISIWDKGLSLLGGLVGISLAILIYSLKEKEQTLKWLDILTIAIISGITIGHLGTFLDGVNYGNPTNLPWGVIFDNPSIKYAVHIHPTQIYALIYSLIIAASLYFVYIKKKLKPGKIMLYGALSYFTMFFLEGFVRGDDVLVRLGLRVEQWFAILIVLITGGFIFYSYNKNRNKKTLTKDNHGSI